MGTNCTGCGSCLAVCPNDAVTVGAVSGILQPTIDKNKCSGCELCATHCPVLRNMYLEPIRPDISRIVGRPLKTYVGFATDSLTRTNGASGGAATALLKYLLDEGIVDYVVTANQKKLVAQPVVITESRQLSKVQGSIYFPSFITKATKEILSNQGKCAAVGLPCQIDSLRLIEAQRKELEERVYVHLGLFCSHTNEYWYLRYLSSRNKGIRCDPQAGSSRHGAWPGSITLETTCGSITIEHQEFWGAIPILNLSSPTGCLFCENHMNIHSDIAIGSLRVRVPRVMKDDVGASTVVAYTKRGLSIVEDAKKKGDISVKEVDLRTLIESQMGSVVAKHMGVPLRRSLIRRRDLVESFHRYPVNDILISLLNLVNSYLGQRVELRRMLCKYRVSEKALAQYQLLMQKMLLKATTRFLRTHNERFA